MGRIVERNEKGEPIRAVGIHQDITDRREQEQQLRQEKDRLDEFASVVSHDLRNPLNVAQGRIDLAREECNTDHLDHAANGVERSLELIENLLDLARTGQEVSDLESVVLTNVVNSCWETVETADAKIVVDDKTTIRADETRLRQLLENLFRNAVEHGSENVTIRVGSLPDGFYIEDDGPGIPEKQHENIWEAGYSGTREGTGFGLSIVKQIVDAHGWNVRVSEGSEGGARFEITGVTVVGD